MKTVKSIGIGLGVGLAAGALVLGFSSAVQAAAPKPAPDASAAVASDGLKVVRDKTTGRVRAPSDEELKEMSAAEPAAAAPAAIQVLNHANGMKSARLPPEMLISVEVSRDANGVLQTRHDRPGMEHGGSTALPTE